MSNYNEKYLKELKELLQEDNKENILKDGYFEYEIVRWDNFSNNILTKYIYPNFETWQIRFYKKENKEDDGQSYITFRLKNYSIWEGHPPYYAKIVLVLHHLNDTACHTAKLITPSIVYFSRDNFKLKFPNFIKEAKLYEKDPLSGKSIIENNKAKVGFYIRYYKTDKKENKSQRKMMFNHPYPPSYAMRSYGGVIPYCFQNSFSSSSSSSSSSSMFSTLTKKKWESEGKAKYAGDDDLNEIVIHHYSPDDPDDKKLRSKKRKGMALATTASDTLFFKRYYFIFISMILIYYYLTFF